MDKVKIELFLRDMLKHDMFFRGRGGGGRGGE